jgi:hypothetical protein
MKRSPFPLVKPGCILLFIGLVLVLLMTQIPTSATWIWDIRWYPLHVIAQVLVCAGSLMIVLGSDVRWTRLQFILVCSLMLIPLGYVAGALNGPFLERALIYSLPVMVTFSAGCWLIPVFSQSGVRDVVHSHRFHVGILLVLGFFCVRSIWLFTVQDVMPFLNHARVLDQAAGGGLFDLLLNEKLPQLRNGYPFGHPNYLSGFLLLALPLVLFVWQFSTRASMRWLSLTVMGLGAFTLLSTQSRNALAGLFLAFLVYVLMGVARKGVPWKWLGGMAVLALLLFLLVPRLSLASFRVSPGRLGIWRAAWWTGMAYFPFGGGEGLTPEMLQKFSKDLPALWGGAMQFHHTGLQVWASGGVLAVLGMCGVLFCALFIGLRTWWSSSIETRRRVLPSLCALSATALVMWADYQLDILPIALLVVFHVIFLVGVPESGERSETPKLPRVLCLAVPLICVLFSLSVVPDAIRSRREVEQAGKAFENGDAEGAVTHYLSAFDAVAEPYALNMAARVLSEDPGSDAQAIELLKKSVDLWEPQGVAHEFLMALYLRQGDHAAAYPHALRRSELTPELRGVYLDLALIGHHLGREPHEIESYFVMELLGRGDLLFPAVWRAIPELETYYGPVMQKFISLDASQFSEPMAEMVRKRKVWAHVLDLIPPEVPLSDEERAYLQTLDTRSEKYALLQIYCQSPEDEKVQALQRLLVYVLRQPLNAGAAADIVAVLDPNQACAPSLLTMGSVQFKQERLGSIGVNARHPYSIPVFRLQRYPTVFGSLYMQVRGSRMVAPREALQSLVQAEGNGSKN